MGSTVGQPQQPRLEEEQVGSGEPQGRAQELLIGLFIHSLT